MISAEIICDSVGEHSPRLTTFLVVFPAFVEQELLRHRSFSFSSSSSRAVPVTKMLAEVRSDELRAAPVWWGREQKGMSSGEELSTEKQQIKMSDGFTYSVENLIDEVKSRWKKTALQAAFEAELFAACGVHKSIVNRILAPFIHRRIIVTTCETGLMNFFGLRLDKTAQAEIRVLAEKMWAAWTLSKPKQLQSNEWHLPFIDPETEPVGLTGNLLETTKRVSAARCARVSYLSFETGRRSTIEEDLKLFDRLTGSSPMHLSPLEHQATPDEFNPRGYKQSHLHGNLPGWIQFRKTILGESLAPLPEGYSR